jgi:hypothetical protein
VGEPADACDRSSLAAVGVWQRQQENGCRASDATARRIDREFTGSR